MKWIKVEGLDSLPPPDVTVLASVVRLEPLRRYWMAEDKRCEFMSWHPNTGWSFRTFTFENERELRSEPYYVTHWILIPVLASEHNILTPSLPSEEET